MSHDTRRFPCLDLSGPPFARGRAHGEAFRSRIARSLEIFAALSPAPLAEAVSLAAESVPYCRDQAPDLMEEVAGIAAGAGRSFEEIFALNASLDLLGSGLLRGKALPQDCWGAALSGAATGGPTFVAWTAEDDGRWLEAAVLLRVRPPAGPPCLLWTFAGFVGRPGLNPHLGLSAVCLPADDCGPGLPYPFVCRRLLGCVSTAEAISALTGMQRIGGMLYLLGDARGALATIKTTARALEVLPGAEGWTGASGPSPRERLGRVEVLLRENWGRNGREELQRIQRDHGSGELCAHGTYGLTTLTVFLADVAAQELWVAYGSPCQHAHVRYGLEQGEG